MRNRFWKPACLAVALTVTPAANADEPPLAVDVQGTCPSRELLIAELAPLVSGYALGGRTADWVVRVQDLGPTYRVSIGGASREVRDQRRGCLERARVAAVFAALNLPESQPRRVASETPTRQPEAAPPAPSTPIRAGASQRGFRVRLFAQSEAAPGAGVTSAGLGAGGSWFWSGVSFTALAAVTTPTTPFQPDSDPVSFELSRLPLSALLGYGLRLGFVDLGLEAGPVLDVLRFEGKHVPQPDSAVRLNPGIRLGALLRVKAGQRVAAELTPILSWYPRPYLVEIERGRALAETPVWWLGASIGLSYTVVGHD